MGFIAGYIVGKTLSNRAQERAFDSLERTIEDLNDPEVQEYRNYQREYGLLGEMYYLATGEFLDQ